MRMNLLAWVDFGVRFYGRFMRCRTRAEAAQAVAGAEDAERASLQHVRVDHRRRDVAVAEQLLHRPDVLPVLEEVRGEGVTERMGARGLGDARGEQSVAERLL